MCQFQTPTFYLRDILMSKHLMGFTIEHFGPLRMRLAQGHVGHSLDGFDQLGTIRGSLIARGLHPRFYDMQGFPTAEHMRIGRDILAITDRCSILVNTDRSTVKLVVLRLVCLCIARVALPEIRAFEKLQPRSFKIDRFQRVNKAKNLWPR